MADSHLVERLLDRPEGKLLGLVVLVAGVAISAHGFFEISSDAPYVTALKPPSSWSIFPNAVGPALLVLPTLVSRIFSRPRATNAPIAAATRPTWSRIVLTLPIPPSELNGLSEQVQTVRTLAQDFYKRTIERRSSVTVDVERVRANVFLPDSRDAADGEVCGLYIPKRLHRGMNDEKELGIRFRPNEGLTGRVFTMQQAYGALRASSGEDWRLIHLEGGGGVGDEKFALTQAQLSRITQELRWIISFPLKLSVAGETHTYGVLNVDGIAEPLSIEEMKAMYQALERQVSAFSLELAKLPKARLSIAVDVLPQESR